MAREIRSSRRSATDLRHSHLILKSRSARKWDSAQFFDKFRIVRQYLASGPDSLGRTLHARIHRQSPPDGSNTGYAAPGFSEFLQSLAAAVSTQSRSNPDKVQTPPEFHAASRLVHHIHIFRHYKVMIRSCTSGQSDRIADGMQSTNQKYHRSNCVPVQVR
jgi:hypothetical protein